MPPRLKTGPQLFTVNDTLSNLTGSWRYVRPVFGFKTAPCADACPVENPMAEAMHLAGKGDIKGALTALKRGNPIPGVCGRVCPHPCTTACNRSGFDGPVGIPQVERFLGDAADRVGLALPEPAGSTGKKVAVIGSGPAGLAAAYHGALAGHQVTLFEADPKPGGLLRYGIPEYRLPRAVLDRELGFIEALGIELMAATPVDPAQFEELQGDYDAVCVATGAQASHRLSVDGEDLKGVLSGLDFLKRHQKGEKIEPGRSTIVIGGGNTALDAARTARRLGSEVLILYRRSREEMPAFEDEIKEGLEEGIALRCHAAPVALVGSGVALKAVRSIEMRPGKKDETGRARPVPVDGSEFDLPADTIITAVGESPEAALLDSRGPNVFLCGDAGHAARTVANALGSGRRAARAIHAFLSGVETQDHDTAKTLASPETLNLAYFRHSEPMPVEAAPAAERLADFREVHPSQSGEAVLQETGRCFSCGYCNQCDNCFFFCPDISIVKAAPMGLPDFDKDYCKGCGICAVECPRGIIEMVEERK